MKITFENDGESHSFDLDNDEQDETLYNKIYDFAKKEISKAKERADDFE